MAKTSKLPPRVFQKHGAFYYVHRNKWTRLGKTCKCSKISASIPTGTRTISVIRKRLAVGVGRKAASQKPNWRLRNNAWS